MRDDVLIIGSGLGGAMLAACLAKQGLSVRMLEAGVHPRFAIGEAATPDISFRFKLLAQRWGVPEIAELSSFYRMREALGPSGGVKRAFSFAYHRPDEPQRPEEVHQYPTFAPPMGPDCHLFRQDADAWMLTVAMGYGAKVEQRTPVASVELREDGVAAIAADGRRFEGRFIVDGAGFGSPLTRQLDLRSDPVDLRTNSRSLFTHMLGVTPYDEIGEPVTRYGMRYPFSEGTLHHVFPGGWMWVIPFNNHADAVNPLASVGLMLDRDAFPDNELPAEEEFREIIARYPGIAARFEGAQAVRPWVKTKRIQHRCRQIVGDRWAMLAQGGAVVDALYSSGLNLTTGIVDGLVEALVPALAEDDLRRERFEAIEARFQANVDIYDRFVANSYRAFPDFDLWDAWYRVWVIALLIGTGVSGNLYLKLLEGAGPELFQSPAAARLSGALGAAVPECREWLDKAFATFERLDEGASPAEVAAELRAQLRETPCSPDYWRFDDPAVRATPAFTMPGMARLYAWFHREAPRSLALTIFDWSLVTAVRYFFREWWRQRRRGRGRSWGYFSDGFRARGRVAGS
ncbi:MAG: tryptophan 7-halogenase [Alphaproteobacteria bacterium]|nr:tryptophan 7-halogenase [Alphaproteobacteria bacterium]